MEQSKNSNRYDLEDRTFVFAKHCRDFVAKLSRTQANIEYGAQLIRSSGSQAANYIEANEAISRKDFFHRIKICRKESKESRLWLKLCFIQDNLQQEQKDLIQEALELTRIFGSIVQKQKIE
jgi:four helix bundle protein